VLPTDCGPPPGRRDRDIATGTFIAGGKLLDSRTPVREAGCREHGASIHQVTAGPSLQRKERRYATPVTMSTIVFEGGVGYCILQARTAPREAYPGSLMQRGRDRTVDGPSQARLQPSAEEVRALFERLLGGSDVEVPPRGHKFLRYSGPEQ
jgi:hypothetical protein